MENASKALIIAGAILLSILLISLGLMVYQQAKGTIGNVNLSEQEIQVFNSKFSSYEGNSVSGTQVNALIEAVISSNTLAARDVTGQYVTITFPATSGSNVTCSATDAGVTCKAGTEDYTGAKKVSPGLTYIVGMSKDPGSGLINSITVTKRTN